MKNINIKHSGLKIVKKKPKSKASNSLIIDFLKTITQEVNQVEDNNPKTKAILKWLSYLFINMESSNIALALIGSENISEEIFWKKLIQPIFGYEYSIAIDDSILKKDISEILKDKVFYNIGNFTTSEVNIEKINKILQAVLVDKYILVNRTKPKIIPVYGQVLITSKEAISNLTKYWNQFEYIDIDDESKVFQELKVDGISDLTLKFTDTELDVFSTILSSFNNLNILPAVVSKIDKAHLLKSLKQEGNEIDTFINAIKNIEIDYFEKVKGIKDRDRDVYENLKNAFNKDNGYFIGQDLFRYYNAIHAQKFKNNKQLMDQLKEKDDMFNQEVKVLQVLTKDKSEKVLFQPPTSTKEEVGSKVLYKINDYTMASDIKIPNGATFTSSQDNIKKYTFESDEEMNKCVKRTKERRVKTKS